MDGRTLKTIIERSGLRTNEVAKSLGIMPQSLNNIFHTGDVKSGIVEKVAKIIGVPVASLYGGCDNIFQENTSGDNNVNIGSYDALRKRDEQIDRLLSIIEKMQGGK